jgi:hypothetical protein
MARLGLAIHEFAGNDSPATKKLVDARAKPWHDEKDRQPMKTVRR